MLNVKGIDHLNIKVNKYKETIKFYQDIFGLEIKEQGKGNYDIPYTIIGKENAIYLALYDMKGHKEISNNDSFVSHFGIHVENFDEAIKFIQDQGIEFGYGGGIINYPNSRSAYIEDPNGLEIELTDKFGGDLK